MARRVIPSGDDFDAGRDLGVERPSRAQTRSLVDRIRGRGRRVVPARLDDRLGELLVRSPVVFEPVKPAIPELTLASVAAPTPHPAPAKGRRQPVEAPTAARAVTPKKSSAKPPARKPPKSVAKRIPAPRPAAEGAKAVSKPTARETTPAPATRRPRKPMKLAKSIQPAGSPSKSEPESRGEWRRGLSEREVREHIGAPLQYGDTT